MRNEKNLETFDPVSVNSKFAICGLPIRLDSYKTCGFGCTYCAANCRKIFEYNKDNQRIGDVDKLSRRLDRVFNQGKFKEDDLLNNLIAQRIDWHLGGMSDPLQPDEEELQVTKQILEVTNQYEIHIVTSTKSDCLYDCDFRPELHSFQLSVSNSMNNKELEPGVPDIEKRVKFFNELKANGFKVGIRVQPFVPGITSTDIIDLFPNADNFTIEGLKLVPQNQEHIDLLLRITGLDRSQFKLMGLLNLRPEERLAAYPEFIEKLEKYHIPYSIADNDLRYMGTNKCCCGDALIHKSSNFDVTTMIKKYGKNWSKEDALKEIQKCGISECNCKKCFASNRVKDFTTVSEMYEAKFDKKTTTFSPQYQYAS